MRCETTARQLKAALAMTAGVVGRRVTIPVLATVKLADGWLHGTDLDTEVAVLMPTLGGMDGEAAIDRRALAALAAHCDADETITLSEEAGTASVRFNGSAYGIASCTPGDFPHLAGPEGDLVETDNLGLAAALTRVAFAISTEETRYYLNGVALLLDADSAGFAAATDGHRLALMPLPGLPLHAAGMILHHRSVAWLNARGIEPRHAVFDAERCRVRLQLPGATLTAKTIDGKFPDIWRVIPKDPEPVVTLPRTKMIAVLRRILAFLGPRNAQSLGVRIGGEDGLLRLTVISAELQASEDLRGIEMRSEPFHLGMNIAYLIEALSRFRGEVVHVGASGDPSSNACVMTSPDDLLTIVQMPRRV